jgi:hypothetical protein
MITQCPAVIQKTQEEAGIDFRDVPSIPAVTDVSLPTILKWAPILDSWLRAAETLAFEKIQRGEKVPGYKLVRKSAHRKWPVDSASKLQKLFKKAGVAILMDDLIDISLKSPKQLEAVAGKAAVDKVAVKPEGGLTLALDTNFREAVTAGSDFEDLL